MLKYLDFAGVSYLWSKIINIQKNNLVYYIRIKKECNFDSFFISKKCYFIFW